MPMSREEFNLCVASALRNSDKRVCFCKIEDGVYCGGMASSLEESLQQCKIFYEENPDCDLKLADYSGPTVIWDKYSILNKIGIISDEEYDKYLDDLCVEGIED